MLRCGQSGGLFSVGTLSRTQREKGRVTATRHQDSPKRSQPNSPILVPPPSLSSEITGFSQSTDRVGLGLLSLTSLLPILILEVNHYTGGTWNYSETRRETAQSPQSMLTSYIFKIENVIKYYFCPQ